jgi:predicted RND superfamily exporter protein
VGAIVITLGFQGHLKTMVDPTMLTVPMFLGLATAVGYSIHIYNFFYQEFLRTGQRKAAVVFAIEKTGWPLLFTALTTIGALLSFVFINIRVLNWVGNASALIVAVTCLLVLFVFPIFLSYGKNQKEFISGKVSERRVDIIEEKMGVIARWTLKNTIGIIVVFTILTVIIVYGLQKIEVDFGNERTMGRRVPYVNKSFQVGQSKIGADQNYDIGIEFSQTGLAKNPDTLERLDAFIKEVESFPLTKRTTSILDQIKEINQVFNEEQDAFYKVPQNRLQIAQMLLLYENAGGEQLDKWVDYNYKKLRIRVEISNYKQNEFLREHQQIKELGRKYFPEAKVFIGGSLAKFNDMSYKVSIGQIESFFGSLLVVAILLIVAFGNFKAGLIALIPNLIPTLAIGGVMGLFRIPLDMITATIMPMILGLAVDDTIHFINHVKYEYSKSGDYGLSVEHTFRTVGKPLFMTSLILVANFGVYMTSVAKIYFHMGMLISVGIILALIAELFLTPICITLVKPFARR